jgi:probable F420-dependent oxidoreductase
MQEKPFRFALVSAGDLSGAVWSARARRAEELGYSTLILPDVLGTPSATLTAMAMAAAATTKLRVGSFVLVNDYRHPALLAREIATLDRLTEGRVELGLGAGAWPEEFQRLGIPYQDAGVRISRLIEGLTIIKQFFTQESVSFSGKYYSVESLRVAPRPLQQPHPPIVIGSGGKRMLTWAAREANTILPTPATDERIGWIREAAGDRLDEIELGQTAFDIELTDGPQSESRSMTSFAVRSRPMTTKQAVELLLARRASLGVSYVPVQESQMENFAPVLARLNGK